MSATPYHLHPLPGLPVAGDIPVPLPPATTGTCWASTAARLHEEAALVDAPPTTAELQPGDRSARVSLEPSELIHISLPPDVPTLTVAEQIEAARADGYVKGLCDGTQDNIRRRMWWEVLAVGVPWGVALGVLLTVLAAGMGWVELPAPQQPATQPMGPAMPMDRGGGIALAMLAAVPLRRSSAATAQARPPSWWTALPNRACEVCTRGATHGGARFCAYPEVTRYASGQPVPVAQARATDGMCGTDARHHVLG